ncbi:hypothetical protein AAFF_G00350290 [Aldrovandia affinis]|uniref:Uncharacterized protein n=1 Tax=Aldrovandia affinis TaxID=143900 RepID=A0AAD7W018_9TELE|nr:hypothetical protein AAFF_G00350290 [Aldrovandia affinis]
MVQKLLRLDWGRPLGSQPHSLTLLLVPPGARWWDLNAIDRRPLAPGHRQQADRRCGCTQAVTHFRDELTSVCPVEAIPRRQRH